VEETRVPREKLELNIVLTSTFSFLVMYIVKTLYFVCF
jgi:hypothetical protein